MAFYKHIPNTVTSLNLFSGILGVIFCLQGNIFAAFVMMLAAAVFDFSDGLLARLLGAYSPVGKELDSLSDMVSFGVLPALMLMETMILHKDPEAVQSWKSWFYLVPLLLAIFSALRLAKFNVDDRQTTSFIGLPTPSSALIAASLCVYIDKTPDCFLAHWAGSPWFLPAVAIVLGILLVSELPMFSLKIHLKRKETSGTNHEATQESTGIVKQVSIVTVAVILAIAVPLAGWHWSLAILLTFLVYILMCVLFAIFCKKTNP
ncbi:MAG: CDP-diacylglycerol--serine O-phosphatidyltransferase [Bacteroidales bacterium]|nr:CDP-diacylglycerol--serine O-phosphatidyltransferase [Bacteroidales bacterium]